MRTTLALFLTFFAAAAQAQTCSEPLDHTVQTLEEHQAVHLCDAYQGKVLLIVNVASKCMYTPQYKGLEALYAKYRNHGFVVLGFPSNDFGRQEPGSEQQIGSFCRLTYGVSFPMFSKSVVHGRDAIPLYKSLARAADEEPGWNFHKYLIGRDGRLIASFQSSVAPTSPLLIQSIEAALKQ